MSATTSTCDHSVYHVVIIALASATVGFATGIGYAVLGQAPLTALASGGAALAFTFGAGMSIVSHVSKRQ